MKVIEQIYVWLLIGLMIVVSVNVFILVQLPSPYSYHESSYSGHELEVLPIKDTKYMKGEVHCLKESEYHRLHQQHRPGLSAIKTLYDYLPKIKAQYASVVPDLDSLIEDLKKSYTQRFFTRLPWKLFEQWVSAHSVIGRNTSGLGDILYAMKSYGIVSADNGYSGTQLKMMLVLEKNQKVIFKPKRYGSHERIEGAICDGADRHNGEIASFHLSLLLNLSMVPPVVGRKFSLRRSILPVATNSLSSTFFIRGGSTCFYGMCYYCRLANAVCDDGKYLEGAVMLWLPEHIHLTYFKHPWARTYKEDQMAKWELSHTFCQTFSPSFFTERNIQRLLNLVDVAVFDFLIQNGDRHHVTLFSQHPNSHIVLLDNGKSFGDPLADHIDILAPLLQCCRIRSTTYDHLLLLTGGGLSHAMRHLLSTDPLSPVLSELHLKALDRRLLFILAAVAMCRDQATTSDNVIY